LTIPPPQQNPTAPILERETPRDILDMRIEAAILVDDEDAGNFPGPERRCDEIPAHRARALRRRILDVARLDPRVVLLDLLCERELRGERLEQHRSGDAADRILARGVKEPAAVDEPVDVAIEPAQDFRMKIGSGFPVHVSSFVEWRSRAGNAFRPRRPIRGSNCNFGYPSE